MCARYEFLEMKMAIEAEAAATAGTSYLSFFRTSGNRKVIASVFLIQRAALKLLSMFYPASLPASLYRFLFAMGWKRSDLVRISIGGLS